MKVTILQKFHDRVDFSKVYLVGETYIFEDARAAALIARGLVASAEEPIESEVEPEVNTVVNVEETVAEEPVETKTEVEPVSKVQPIVKQTRKRTPKAN